MPKIIFVTNSKNEAKKVKKIALKNKYDFKTYTEEEWATFEEIEQHIQDEEISKKIASLPLGHRPICSLKEMEMEVIKKIINNVDGNAVRAAKTLKIGRATLYRKLGEYGLSLKQVRDEKELKPEKVQPIKPSLNVVKKAS